MLSPEQMTEALSYPLPAVVARLKEAGAFCQMETAMEQWLSREIPQPMRYRLILEKERIRRLTREYTLAPEAAYSKACREIPSMNEVLFQSLENAGRIDFLYIDGQKRYFCRFTDSLLRFPEFSGKEPLVYSPWLNPAIEELKATGKALREITLRTELRLKDVAFVPGEYTVHLPYPIPCAQQSNIRLLKGEGAILASEQAEHRTAYWRQTLSENRTFTLEYCYLSAIRYADPLHQAAPAEPLYPDELPPTEQDTSETAFIRFTPYCRALCAELSAGAKTDAEKAWRFYDYITTHVKYSYVKDYFLIDDPAGYCAANLTGDCGLQALMFITLCRIAGIPARWQSGMDVEAQKAGSHDWAQFYLPGWGWLFADPSFGGGGFRNGSEERRRFYFGNIDPMRMAANRVYSGQFEVPLGAIRCDPSDNQDGEIACAGADLPFTPADFESSTVTVSIIKKD